MTKVLIAGLGIVLLIVILLVLKKTISGKALRKRIEDEAVSAAPPEEITEEELEEIQSVEEIPDTSAESALEDATIAEPEHALSQELEVEFEPEPEPPEAVAESVAETMAEEPVLQFEQPVVEEETEDLQVPESEEETELTVESYEQELLSVKEKLQADLTAAINNNQEKKREQLQIEFVTITESLDFLELNYKQVAACRNDALKALPLMRDYLEGDEHERIRKSLHYGDTRDAEKVLDELATRDVPISALAVYLSGRLAECRIDLNRAMVRYEKAVQLEEGNPDYLRSAAMLARKLYHHKKALKWFASLVQILEEKGEDSIELALARRELAYSTLLVGRHKQAGVLYKKAMTSISKLLGKDDPELGICWYQIGKQQEAIGKYEVAEEPYKKALAILEKKGRDVVLLDILDKLGRLYMELEREGEAIVLFERLCTLKEQSPNPDSAALIVIYNNLGEAYKFSGKYPESEEKYKRALALTEQLRGEEHPAVGSVLQQLVAVCQKQKKMEEAEAYETRARAIFQRVVEEQEAKGQQSVNLTIPEK